MADQNLVPGASSVIPADIAQNVDPRLTAMFVKPSGLVGVQSTFTHFVEPTKAYNNTDTEFTFTLPTTDGYVDLKNINLYVKGRLTRKDKSLLQAEDPVSLANNFMHSLWRSVTLHVGRGQLEIYEPDHAYKAYIRQLLRFDTHSTDMLNEGMTVEVIDRSKSDSVQTRGYHPGSGSCLLDGSGP